MLCSAGGSTVRRCGVEQQHRRFPASLGVRHFLMTDASMAPQHFRMSAISVGPWSRKFDPKLLPRGCALCFETLNQAGNHIVGSSIPMSLGVTWCRSRRAQCNTPCCGNRKLYGASVAPIKDKGNEGNEGSEWDVIPGLSNAKVC